MARKIKLILWFLRSKERIAMGSLPRAEYAVGISKTENTAIHDWFTVISKEATHLIYNLVH